MLRVWANLFYYISCEVAASARLGVDNIRTEVKIINKCFSFLKKKGAGFCTADAHVCHSCTDLFRACVGCVNSEWPGALPLTSGITVISVDWSDWSDSSPRDRNPAAGGSGGESGRDGRCLMQINKWLCFYLFGGLYVHFQTEKHTFPTLKQASALHTYVWWVWGAKKCDLSQMEFDLWPNQTSQMAYSHLKAHPGHVIMKARHISVYPC